MEVCGDEGVGVGAGASAGSDVCSDFRARDIVICRGVIDARMKLFDVFLLELVEPLFDVDFPFVYAAK